MNIVVVYIYPLSGGNGAGDNALRFLHSYHLHPSILAHRLVVVCNGAPLNAETQALFESVPECVFMEHNNAGYDIGAFQRAAREFPCDMMLFLGNSAYIRGAGWLERMAEAYEKHGNTIYGSMENSGDSRFGVYPHIRTSGFWMHPELLNSYPQLITRPDQRYGFEHGRDSLTRWCQGQGLTPLIVTWSGEYGPESWGRIPGGFHRGKQEGLITGDKHSAPPYYITM